MDNIGNHGELVSQSSPESLQRPWMRHGVTNLSKLRDLKVRAGYRSGGVGRAGGGSTVF